MSGTAQNKLGQTGNARADTLLGLTEDFVRGNSQARRPELIHYPAIAGAMLPYVDLSTRAGVARLLADHPDIPHRLAQALAEDAIEAAAPILRTSDILSEGDLIRIIRNNSVEHSLAICDREALGDIVVDALLSRGHPRIDEALHANHGAKIMADQAQWLARRRADDTGTAVIAETVAVAEQLETVRKPAPMVATTLPDRTLAKLFWAGDRSAREAVMTVVSRKPSARIATLDERFGGLAARICDALVQLAETGRAEDLIAGLARVASISRANSARILADESGEPLAMLLGAMQVSREQATSLLAALAPHTAARSALLLNDIEFLKSGASGRLFQALCDKPCDEQIHATRREAEVTQAQRVSPVAARRGAQFRRSEMAGASLAS
ncbi:DUF2336 domain-containing protein [Tepidamorphus sp. 3E244]|uniref:DUF2336 domain-containing protein n=1 Tax=Tepidamorphus sp. 3E244 TaxID=3385498 RepID=UPI0038FD3D91